MPQHPSIGIRTSINNSPWSNSPASYSLQPLHSLQKPTSAVPAELTFGAEMTGRKRHRATKWAAVRTDLPESMECSGLMTWYSCSQQRGQVHQPEFRFRLRRLHLHLQVTLDRLYSFRKLHLGRCVAGEKHRQYIWQDRQCPRVQEAVARRRR